MEIEFADDELKDLISDPEKMKDKFGEEAAEKISQAIQALSEAETLSDIDELLDDSDTPEDEGPLQLSRRLDKKSRQVFADEAGNGHTSTSLYF